jgi:hypothetical protein
VIKITFKEVKMNIAEWAHSLALECQVAKKNHSGKFLKMFEIKISGFVLARFFLAS